MPFALRNTYAHFKRNPWCGGLTGELRVERPYRNFLTSVQYMEWKVRLVARLGWVATGGRPGRC
jgi:chitin synthase